MKTPDQLIDFIARNEGGEHGYSSFNPDDNGAGIAFGAWQFNQKRGTLPKLLQWMHKADSTAFSKLFGASNVQSMLNEKLVRGAEFDHPVWKPKFQAAGQHPPFQQVQRALAREEYLEPAAKELNRWLINTERAVAMGFDIAVQYGLGGLERMVVKAIGNAAADQGAMDDPPTLRDILEELADLADTHEYDANRRHKLLHSPALSDEPWTGLGTTPPPAPTPTRPTLRYGTEGEDVRDLQRLLSLAGYTIKGWSVSAVPAFRAVTLAMVRAFQMDHGLVVDGIVGPLTWKALDTALAAAGAEGEN